MTRKKFFNGRHKIGFLGLAALALSFGLALASCDSAAGTLPSDELSVSAAGASTTQAKEPLEARSIRVKFVVKNGGWGLMRTSGIVSSQNDDIFATTASDLAYGYYININVPSTDQYVNIRWCGMTAQPTVPGKDTFVKAKMSLSSESDYTIGLDYNGAGDVETTNLYDVSVTKDWTGDNADWNDALSRAAEQSSGIDISLVGAAPAGVVLSGNTYTVNASGDYVVYNSNPNFTSGNIDIAENTTATLTLDNVTMTGSGGSAINVAGGASLTLLLKGTNVLKSGAADAAGIHVAGAYAKSGAALTIDGSGTLTVYGGQFAAGIGGSQAEDGGTITISGGTIETVGSPGPNYPTLWNADSAGGNTGGAGIGGGGYRASDGHKAGDGGFITITGGNVTAKIGTNDWGAACIGGGGMSSNNTFKGGQAGTIVISGGTVVADASANPYSTGIGSGYSPYNKNDDGSITISGGTVYASGSNCSSAIGGGFCGNGGTINISGNAVVYALGSLNNQTGNPGVIGGGRHGACGTVNISGGVVVSIAGTAEGSIAGGSGSSGTAINISGGTIIANRNIGIGSSYGGTAPVTISGNPVIFANGIRNSSNNGNIASDPDNGILANGEAVLEYTGYGWYPIHPTDSGKITPNIEFIVPSGATLTIPNGWVLYLMSTRRDPLQPGSYPGPRTIP